METQKNLLDLDFLALKSLLNEKIGIEEKKLNMRAQQIYNAVYQKGLNSFKNLTTMPLDLRDKLDENISFNKSKIVETHTSSDGTLKFLIELPDRNKVECVYIPEKTRGTICVSSQVGCSLTCTFCRSGTQKLVKNLSVSEIVGQVMLVKDKLKDWGDQKIISNIVFMGQGEPLINIKNLKIAIRILKDKKGLNYGNKKITVSTSGIANKIPEAANEIGTYLALSLHAPNDKLREEIMPINKKFKLKDLIEQLKYYTSVVKEPIFLEYVMLKGVNDTEKCAKELVKLMAQFPSKVNLIEFNSWPGVKFQPTERKDIEKFSKFIQEKGYMSFIRRSRGDDVLAACGQLRTESEKIKI
ncbi:23S rRNA (adenine(2503)-C(2))-methyltransferase RlmN [Pelagibacteraceae bacterium]|nr:23S rRNA (adenine(2503)-C(2))-methyltransferase RlmN [Pelagibacteraceae bacterium]